MPAALTIDWLPETGSSEDLPQLYGAVPSSPTLVQKPTPMPTIVAPPAPVQPPPVPTPFPPAPTPPVQAPLPPAPLQIQVPARPQMKVEVVAPTTPYQAKPPGAVKIPTRAPVGTAAGGNLIAVKKDLPTGLKIGIKLLGLMIIFLLLAGVIYLFIAGIITLPQIPSSIGLEKWISVISSINWLIPASLLAIGGALITFGYILQKSSKM